jgi:hypothetical protein
MKALRALAMKYPDVEEGIACKGTAVECATFKVGGKAFLFVGRADIRLKLDKSLREVAKLAQKAPERFHAGVGGWIKVTFSDDEPLPLANVKRWLAESYGLMAPKPKTAGKNPKKLPSRARSAAK